MFKRLSAIGRIAVFVALVSLVALPAGGTPAGSGGLSGLASRLSGGPLTKYWISHPDQAPPAIRSGLEAAIRQAGRGTSSTGALAATSGVFNFDDVGLPQNEESVDVCRANPRNVIGGTNDYRYVLDPEGNSTGWHLSTNGGASLRAEGLLPHIDLGGIAVPSGGDPVVRFDDANCAVYAGDLNYTFGDAFPDNFPNGIGLYRTDVATLKSCPSGGSDPSCWPTSIFAATAADNHHFLDKEWFDVGVSGGDNVVWVTWSDFLTPDLAVPEAFTASIWAARCDAALTACTAPIDISGADEDIQFSYVTIGPDGRVYVTWAEIQGELTGDPETFIIKLRVAEPGETTFGSTQVVETVNKPIGFDNALYGHTFRVATVPKNAVKMVGGQPRVYVTWEECASRPLGYCQNPSVWVAWSDDLGVTWDKTKVSAGGDNYFPTIAADSGNRIAVAYFTSRHDRPFQLGQDVELVTLNAKTLAVKKRQRLTKPSNNPNADWFFSGGVFIGDYIEVAAYRGKAYVHTNLNYEAVRFLGGPPGKAEQQQDNYLFVRPL